jgi:hypothetical protein
VAKVKSKVRRENLSPMPPIRANAVELTPPAANGAEVQEKVTEENIVDIQRYLRWADKAIKSRLPKKQSRRSQAAKAA